MLTVQLLVGRYQSITVLAPNVAGEACPSSRSRASSALFTHVHTINVIYYLYIFTDIF